MKYIVVCIFCLLLISAGLNAQKPYILLLPSARDQIQPREMIDAGTVVDSIPVLRDTSEKVAPDPSGTDRKPGEKEDTVAGTGTKKSSHRKQLRILLNYSEKNR